MATTMEGFDQVVVGGASCSSEVIIIIIAFTVIFFFALADRCRRARGPTLKFHEYMMNKVYPDVYTR